jgi:predicted dinucleotide-binding enzyme
VSAGCRAGHDIVIGGRSPEHADAAAKASGARTRPLPEVGVEADAVLLSVHWEGVTDILTAAGSPAGSLAGKPLIDPTNAVEHGVGLDRARQLEEVAGFVIALAFAGVDPQSAIPAVPSPPANATPPQS